MAVNSLLSCGSWVRIPPGSPNIIQLIINNLDSQLNLFLSESRSYRRVIMARKLVNFRQNCSIMVNDCAKTV